MIWAYARAPRIHLWSQPHELHWVAAVVVLIGFALIALGLATPNPTRVGAEGLLRQLDEPARGVLRITRHPFLMGVALWGLAHLATNGDAASVLLFGSLGGLALLGPRSIDRRKARLGVPGWETYAASTSILPFAAIASGRNRFAPSEIRLWPVGAAALAYAALLAGHLQLFGVAPLAF